MIYAIIVVSLTGLGYMGWMIWKLDLSKPVLPEGACNTCQGQGSMYPLYISYGDPDCPSYVPCPACFGTRWEP